MPKRTKQSKRSSAMIDDGFGGDAPSPSPSSSSERRVDIGEPNNVTRTAVTNKNMNRKEKKNKMMKRSNNRPSCTLDEALYRPTSTTTVTNTNLYQTTVGQNSTFDTHQDDDGSDWEEEQQPSFSTSYEGNTEEIKPVCAIAIDEEAYRQEILNEVQKLQLTKENNMEKDIEKQQVQNHPLVHAVKAEEDNAKPLEGKSNNNRRCMYVGIAVGCILMLIGIGVGVAVVMTKEPNDNTSIQSFADFCLAIVGFYALEEPRFDCTCSNDGSHVVHCHGKVDEDFYSAVVFQYNENDGSFMAGECHCTDSNCPETSFQCFTAYSKNFFNCIISVTLPPEQSLCEDDNTCSLCDSDRFYTFKVGQCGISGPECLESRIPKPQL